VASVRKKRKKIERVMECHSLRMSTG